VTSSRTTRPTSRAHAIALRATFGLWVLAFAAFATTAATGNGDGGIGFAGGLLLGVIAGYGMVLPTAGRAAFAWSLGQALAFAVVLPVTLALLSFSAVSIVGRAVDQPFTFFPCCQSHDRAGDLLALAGGAWVLQPWSWALGLWIARPWLARGASAALAAAAIFAGVDLHPVGERIVTTSVLAAFEHPLWSAGAAVTIASWWWRCRHPRAARYCGGQG
jgi:hypothetical protein